MRKTLCALALLMTAAALPAKAEVVTFDDLSPTAAFVGNYKGLDWNNFKSLSDQAYGFGHGWASGTVSKANIAYNWGGAPASISVASGTFDFDSAYFTAAWIDGLKLKMTGYNGANALYTQTFTLNTLGPLLIDLDWKGLTKLDFSSYYCGCSDAGRQFVVDNLKVNISAVPEPATWGLMIVGFGAVGAAMRGSRRRLAAAT